MRRRPALLIAIAALSAACTSGRVSSTAPTQPVVGPTRASPAATAGSTGPVTGATNAWATFMGDSARSGVGPPMPAAGRAHRTWTTAVDGDVYAQPLVVGSTVVAATERNSVYALDVASGAVRWRVRLGNPVPLGQLECGNIDPNGVTSTPVVDAAAGTVYVVAMLAAPVRHELFALRLKDGGVLWRRVVDPAGGDPGHLQQRGALNLWGGSVYFSYGGFEGDCDPYHGWVVGARTDGSGSLRAWQVPSQGEGGIWAPPGPVISPTGDVWVSTGNTQNTPGGTPDAGPYDGANSVFHLDSALTGPVDSWAPANWATLNRGDIDLGSLAPVLLASKVVFIAGKDGIGYLLRQGALGGVGGDAFHAVVCPDGGPGGGARGGAAVTGDTVFVPCTDGLTAVRVNAARLSFGVLWRGRTSANSPVLAYGLVWTVSEDSGGLHQSWTGSLTGLDPVTGSVRVRVLLGGVAHFPSPSAAGGALFIGGLGQVYAVSAT